VSLLVVGRPSRREGGLVCVQVCIVGWSLDYGGFGGWEEGWCACGIAWVVFKCIMCLGVWLAMGCDAVGDGKKCEFYNDNSFSCT
jgi:hypothetical protein